MSEKIVQFAQTEDKKIMQIAQRKQEVKNLDNLGGHDIIDNVGGGKGESYRYGR